MAQLSQPGLLRQITSALTDGGTTFTVLENRKPFLIALNAAVSEAREPFRVYIWNVTHGGKSRDPDEYRIQVTPSMSAPSPNEQVVVLGWHDETAVFAAWDPKAHSQRHSASPSLQVGLAVLERAANLGVSAELRGSGDSVLAFRPELLEFYLESSELLHSMPIENLVELMSGAGTLDSKVADETAGVEPRGVVEKTVLRRYRDATFSFRVKKAYGNACSICGLQLSMIEAAHIVPVAVVDSTDETSNGIALCRNHHHAFDQGLIIISDDFSLSVNSDRVESLREESQLSGLEKLLPNGEGARLRVPTDHIDQPSAYYLARGRSVRKIGDVNTHNNAVEVQSERDGRPADE